MRSRCACCRPRLTDLDNDWATLDRVENLRPGAYRFEVLAANAYGVWNESPATFAFSLAPHFWQTWLFYVLCALGVVGAAAGIQSYWLRWQRRVLKLEEDTALANTIRQL